ncbi:MAG: Clp protease N-terminal domain-containing protein [Chloroflexota bacterium]
MTGDTSASRMVEAAGPRATALPRAAGFFGANAGPVPGPELEVTTVALARALARSLGHPAVGTDHVLMALTIPTAGVVASMLASMGLDPSNARAALCAARGETPDWHPPIADAGFGLVGGTSGSYSLDATGDLESLSPDEQATRIQEFEDLMVFAGLESGRLVRVVAIGQVREARDVTMEIIALEIRETGSRLIWRARSATREVGLQPMISVSDDRDTVYRTMNGGGSGGNDPEGWHAEGEVMVSPSPPRDARALVIVVAEVDRWSSMPLTPSAHIPFDGGWRFDIGL